MQYGRRRLASTVALVLLTTGNPAGVQEASAATFSVTGVSPASSSGTVGAIQQLTATISPSASLLTGNATVTFNVNSGPNRGLTLSCTVTAALLGASTCSVSYSSTLSGTDTLLATAGAGDAGAQAAVTWQGIPSFIVMSPVVSYNTMGGTARVTATVIDQHGGAVPGANVAFSASGTGSENPSSGSAATDASGNAEFQFGSAVTGTSTITAAVSRPGGPAVTATAAARWAGPPAAISLSQQNPNALAPVGGTDSVKAAVSDASGNPVGDDTPVAFTVTGPGARQGTAQTSAGNAVFTFGSDVTGTSTITATVGGLTSNAVTVTWQPRVAATVRLTPKQGAAVVGGTKLLVAEVLDQFGQDFSGALVRFSVQGANAQPTTSSQITNSTGRVGFQDQGSNPGFDTIVAYVDLHNDFTLDPDDPHDTANVVWLRKPGQGYWLVASDGGIFAFGPSASFEGSAGSAHLNQPVVGMAASPSGQGYWLVASDGGIFAFGDAAFRGSTGSAHLNKPVVGMATSPSGQGYWLVASDGGIFAFGDAAFRGSTGAMHLNKPVVGIGAMPDGSGYTMAASDGGVFNFGGAPAFGSAAGGPLNQPVVGMAIAP